MKDLSDDLDAARLALLEAALGAPAGDDERALAATVTGWLTTTELRVLAGWTRRACNLRTAGLLDVLARVAAALGDAERDAEGRYVVLVGPTLARHLLDQIRPNEGNTRS